MIDQDPPAGRRVGRRAGDVGGSEPGRTYFAALGRWLEYAGLNRGELAKRLGKAESTISQVLGNKDRGPEAGTPTALEWARRVIGACGTEQDLANWTAFHHEVIKYKDGFVTKLPPPPEPGEMHYVFLSRTREARNTLRSVSDQPPPLPPRDLPGSAIVATIVIVDRTGVYLAPGDPEPITIKVKNEKITLPCDEPEILWSDGSRYRVVRTPTRTQSGYAYMYAADLAPLDYQPYE